MGTMTITVESFFDPNPNPTNKLIAVEESNDDCETVYSIGVHPDITNSSVYFSWVVEVGDSFRYSVEKKVSGTQSYITATNGETLTENTIFKFTLKAYQLKRGGWSTVGSTKIKIRLEVYTDSSETTILGAMIISRSGGDLCRFSEEEDLEFLGND